MFRQDESGGVMTIFALALPVLLAGVAGAVEVTRMTAYKQRITSATELSCNQGSVYVYAQRQIDLTKDYSPAVKDIATNNVSQKQLGASVTINQANVDPTTVHIRTTGTMPYSLAAFLPSASATFNVSRDCLVVTDPKSNSTLLLSESFETGHSVQPNNWDVLKSWNGWTTTNAGIEINGQRALSGNTIKNGDFFAELDSDCNTWANSGQSNCHSNSGMSQTFTNLAAGDYEIRYYYIARLRNSGYGTQTICADLTKPQGQQRDDSVSWAQLDGQTNRIEVYVEKTSDATFQMKNMVDVCISSYDWVERKINFTLTKKGDYRFAWRAAGREDSYGGLIDYLRVCKGTCP